MRRRKLKPTLTLDDFYQVLEFEVASTEQLEPSVPSVNMNARSSVNLKYGFVKQMTILEMTFRVASDKRG